MKALPLSLLLFSGAALADDAILKCRQLTDGGARLACYDAIDVSARGATAATAPVAPLASDARRAEDSFGMAPPKPKRDEAPKSISSTIAGEFDGWGPGARITLANGQVWRVVDGGAVALPRMRNPKVTIERGLLGAVYLSVEGSNQTARVSREK